ncbi:MAG: hypothetical protein FJ318_10650 [SAR202 cluster bacterium]|nr:hypothetical protein [SAR202 cluster bacterium]
MAAFIRSVMVRAAWALLLLALLAPPAAAQMPFTMADAPATPQFLSRFDVHMSAARLSDTDPRFSWDTHWAGDLDLVDFVHGRVSFLTDYQALLGSEFRPFDPYQPGFPISPWYPTRRIIRRALISRGSDVRNPTTEGDTRWVKKKTVRFSSHSTAS